MDEKASGISQENRAPARGHSAFLSGIASRDFQARKTVEQRAAGHTQFARGTGSITAILVQAVDQKYPLHPLQSLTQRCVNFYGVGLG